MLKLKDVDSLERTRGLTRPIYTFACSLGYYTFKVQEKYHRKQNNNNVINFTNKASLYIKLPK